MIDPRTSENYISTRPWQFDMMDKSFLPQVISRDGVSVSLTHDRLDVASVVSSVRSPKAGATVLFAGKFSSYLPACTKLILGIRNHA